MAGLFDYNLIWRKKCLNLFEWYLIWHYKKILLFDWYLIWYLVWLLIFDWYLIWRKKHVFLFDQYLIWSKGTHVLFISTDNSIIKQMNVSFSCARSCLFLSENFRVSCKYKANVAMEAMEGTVQKGSIPTWMEVVFVTNFYMNKKQFDCLKEIL